MSRPSSHIFSALASALFSKRVSANKVFPFPHSIGINCTRIATVGDKIMTQDMKYCSAWFLRGENGLYVCGHAKMLLSSGEGNAEIMHGLSNFRHLVSKDEQLELVVARRMFDERFSTLSHMSLENQKECVAAIQAGCKDLGLTISNLQFEFIGSATIVIDGKEIKDLSRLELFMNLARQNKSDSIAY